LPGARGRARASPGHAGSPDWNVRRGSPRMAGLAGIHSRNVLTRNQASRGRGLSMRGGEGARTICPRSFTFRVGAPEPACYMGRRTARAPGSARAALDPPWLKVVVRLVRAQARRQGAPSDERLVALASLRS